jgi:penicillin-binding protein 1A
MPQAYDDFGNGGYRVNAYGIERIRTADGKVLYDHGPPQRTPVITEPALGEMDQMMRQVIAAGTGTRARIAGYDLAGKTGTTSDYRDAWFIGFTGGFVAAVWVGKDDNSPMRKVTGGGPPAEIWRNFMAQALPRLAARPIPSASAPDAGLATPASDVSPVAVPPSGAEAPPAGPAPSPAPARKPRRVPVPY